MSNSCSQCGNSIPDDQRICSMCYGDSAYGHDGYYSAYLEEQEKARYEAEQQAAAEEQHQHEILMEAEAQAKAEAEAEAEHGEQD